MFRSGKRIEIDPSTGELIPCEDDNGIDSIRLLWGDESNQSDTVFSTVSGSIIRLNTNFVSSSLKPECPPPALSEVEFTITGPDNQCFYELEVSESALKKGYKLSDILYSLEGDQGGFKPLKKWQNKESGPMNVWVKVKSTQQKINVSKSRNYKSCTIDICNETKKNKQLKELEKELAEFIKSYDDSASWQNLIQGKKLIFKKDGNDVPKEEFKTEVAVNGDNMLYAGDANGISIESIKLSLTANIL